MVVGGSLFDTLDESLSGSIVGSTTGHLQVYSGRSKDPLEVYGKMDGSDSNLAPIEDFPKLKAKLLKLPNVATVVPMGTSGAMLGSGNTIDLTLEKLRSLYRDKQNGQFHGSDADFAARADAVKGHVRQILTVLVREAETQKDLLDENAIEPDEREALKTASTDAFWASFDEDPFAHLELLENKISPQLSDADLLFIRYLGTDLAAFEKTFKRMEIVDGTAVPAGRRGLLMPKFFYEESMKLKNARRLDKMRDALDAGRKLSDTSDKELQRFLRENQSQTREIVLQLDREGTRQAVQKLQALLGSQETDLVGAAEGLLPADRRELRAAIRLLLRAAGADARPLPGAGGRHVEPEELRALRLGRVGRGEAVRHLPVQGAGEVAARRRAGADRHGQLPRPLRLPHRRTARPSWRRCRRRRRCQGGELARDAEADALRRRRDRSSSETHQHGDRRGALAEARRESAKEKKRRHLHAAGDRRRGGAPRRGDAEGRLGRRRMRADPPADRGAARAGPPGARRGRGERAARRRRRRARLPF